MLRAENMTKLSFLTKREAWNLLDMQSNYHLIDKPLDRVEIACLSL